MPGTIRTVPETSAHMKRTALILAALAAAAMAGCTDSLQGRALQTVSVLQSPNPWPTPQIATGGAPHIQAFWMNETEIPSGSDWIGRAVTGTNVASLEIRTESFSFVAERTAFGQFRFSQHVLDIIPPYRRAYTLQVIARNAAGEEDSILVPIRFK